MIIVKLIVSFLSPLRLLGIFFGESLREAAGGTYYRALYGALFSLAILIILGVVWFVLNLLPSPFKTDLSGLEMVIKIFGILLLGNLLIGIGGVGLSRVLKDLGWISDFSGRRPLGAH